MKDSLNIRMLHFCQKKQFEFVFLLRIKNILTHEFTRISRKRNLKQFWR